MQRTRLFCISIDPVQYHAQHAPLSISKIDAMQQPSCSIVRNVSTFFSKSLMLIFLTSLFSFCSLMLNAAPPVTSPEPLGPEPSNVVPENPLLTARLAIARADGEALSKALRLAQSTGATGAEGDDVARIQSLSNRMTQARTDYRSKKPGAAQTLADILVEQSEGLIAYEQFGVAKQLALQAQELRAVFAALKPPSEQVPSVESIARKASPSNAPVGVVKTSLEDEIPNAALQRSDEIKSTSQNTPSEDAVESSSQQDSSQARRMIDDVLSRAADPSSNVPTKRNLLPPPAALPSNADATTTSIPVDLKIAKLSAEIASSQLEAKRLSQRDPSQAMTLLDEAGDRIAATDIPEDSRAQLSRRIERTRKEIEESSGKRRSEVALDKQNNEVLKKIDKERAAKVEVDKRLAMLVEQYNTLIDEKRFPEAEAIAKKAGQLSPDNIVVRQLLSQSRTIRRLETQRSIDTDKSSGFLDVVEDTERSSKNFVGPIEFPATKDWEDLTKSRSRLAAEAAGRGNASEQAIEKKLRTPVKLDYHNQPLAVVVGELGKQSGIPIHLDLVGLEQETVGTDTPISISLDQPISLKSVLKLILEPLNLDYVIKDEVLKITSPRAIKGELYTVSYQVADLVIPIRSFSSDNGAGITGALRDAHARIGFGSGPGLSVATGPAPAGIPSGDASNDSSFHAGSLAQMQGGNGPVSGAAQPSGFGPPKLGGSQADFQSLIDLIQQTVAPQSWNTVGGNGAIQPFANYLSLVVSQTQEVHEDLADLLTQLRRLQDLQVTIEVRFILLNDTFFERIGVDFDFNIASGVTGPLNMTAVPRANNTSVSPESLGLTPGGTTSQVIGLDPTGNPGVVAPSSFSIPFRQNSFGSATVPSLPGLPDVAGSAANMGFAILSDIEAYFLIQAAQGNTRSNILQAPKVTLFNGQQAFVSDTTQRPFVSSVVPVVGDFAAAQQPVVIVLSEGTALNVQAVVSNDRRFVRLTLVPFFSQIGEVQEFTFDGSRSTSSKSSDEKVGADGENTIPGVGGFITPGVNLASRRANDTVVQAQGTTIQLPEFIFTTVTTTVSVPDGGTVLLGGIKRLREGRNEFGVPILSKVPYINRLFKNVGIARTTQSLMLMVTPRIIIQEEEESNLLGTSKP